MTWVFLNARTRLTNYISRLSLQNDLRQAKPMQCEGYRHAEVFYFNFNHNYYNASEI